MRSCKMAGGVIIFKVCVCAHIHMGVTQANNCTLRRRLSGIMHMWIRYGSTNAHTYTLYLNSIISWQWTPFPPRVRLSSRTKTK